MMNWIKPGDSVLLEFAVWRVGDIAEILLANTA
jgi:hypothetical protein